MSSQPPLFERPLITTPRPGADVQPTRHFQEFTLPAKYMGMGWGSSGFVDEDRTFRMCELTSRQKEAAGKRAGQSTVKLTHELVFGSISQVGSWATANARDAWTTWWDAIGPKAQRLVEAAFVQLNSVDEEDVASFLGSGTQGAS